MKLVVAVLCMALLLPEGSAQTAKRKPSTPTTTDAVKEKSGSTPLKESPTATGKPPGATAKDAPPKPGATKPPTSTAVNTGAKKQKAPTEAKKDSTPSASEPGTKASKIAAPSSTQKKSTTPKLDKPPQDNAGEEPTRHRGVTGPNITLDPEDLADFDRNSERVKRLIVLSLELTRRGLTYRYGSSDPSTGGMDCSGTIYYLLKAAGLKEPPRDSSGIYLWAQKEGTLHRVSPQSLDASEMYELRPGDLLFWEGTYEVQRDPPISHTMIYLGREKKTGIPVMVGASDGRTYGSMKRNGVSVFDFKLPRADSAAKFVAYARVPGFR